jgi:hypothetical protein
MNKLLAAAASLAAAAPAALAHEGHGAAGAHWHATDVWGFVALGAGLALYFWVRRGK